MRFTKLIILPIFLLSLCVAAESKDTSRPNNLELHKLVIKNVAFIDAICAFATFGQQNQLCDIAILLDFLIPVTKNQSLEIDIPLIELAEFYFGESVVTHKEAVAQRSSRVISKIEDRILRDVKSCANFGIETIEFINKGYKNFRCGDAQFVKNARLYLIARNKEFHVKPRPSHEFELQVRSYSGAITQLPALQAAYQRSKGMLGWPSWFRIGVFIDVMARDKDPFFNAPLLELRDFSLGAEADATLQKALRLRMRTQPAMRALIEARLQHPPTWFAVSGIPELQGDFYEPGYMPETLKAMRQYGVVALTKQQRNIELRKLLRPDKP